MRNIKILITGLIAGLGLLIAAPHSVQAAEGSALATQVTRTDAGTYRLKVTNQSTRPVTNVQGATTLDATKATKAWTVKAIGAKASVEIDLGKLAIAGGTSQAAKPGAKTDQAGTTTKLAVPAKPSADHAKKHTGVLAKLGSTKGVLLSLIGAAILVGAVVLFFKHKRTAALLLLLGLGLGAAATPVQAATGALTQKLSAQLTAGNRTLTFNTAVTYDQDPGTHALAGTITGADGHALANQKLTAKAGSDSQTTTTDAQGNFFLHIQPDVAYTLTSGADFKATVTTTSPKEATVKQHKGRLTLGKMMPSKTDDQAYAQLNISTIYLLPSAVSGIKADQMTVAGHPDLRAGDVVMVGPSADNLGGASLTVATVQTVGGQTVITGTTPKLDDVYQELHSGADGLQFGEPEMVLGDGIDTLVVTNRSTHTFTQDIIPTQHYSVPEKFIKKYMPSVDAASMSLSFGMSGKGSVDLSFLKGFEEASLTVSPYAQLRGELKKSGSYDASKSSDQAAELSKLQKALAGITIAEVKVPTEIPSVVVKVPVTLEPVVTAEGKLEINLKADAQKTFGLSYANGKSEEINGLASDKNGASIDGKLEGSATADLSVNVAVSLTGAGVNVAELGGGIGSQYNLSANIAAGIGTGDYSDKSGLDADGNSDVKIYAKVHGALLKDLTDKATMAPDPFEKTIWQTGKLALTADSVLGSKGNTIYVKPGETVNLQAKSPTSGSLLDSFSHVLALSTHPTVGQVLTTPVGMTVKVADNAIIGKTFDAKVFQTLTAKPLVFLNKGNVKFEVRETLDEGVLTGNIVDALNNTPLAGVTLDFYDAAGSKVKTGIKTDQAGDYKVTLPVGRYTAKIHADHYIAETAHNIQITKGNTTYNAKLKMVDIDYSDIGTVTGQIKDSVTGRPVAGATLSFLRGVDVTEGTPVAEGITTDASGNYSVKLPGGNYTMAMAKPNYIDGTAGITAIGHQTSGQQNGTLTPKDAGSAFRIVLRWGANPRDLDSHLTGPAADGGRFHIWFSHKRYEDALNSANLDVDDTSSYGPETVTILKSVASGAYAYAVHRYAGSGSLKDSDATVEVYKAGQKVATYHVPNLDGELWHVFKIVDGQVIPVNQMTDSWGTPGTDDVAP